MHWAILALVVGPLLLALLWGVVELLAGRGARGDPER